MIKLPLKNNLLQDEEIIKELIKANSKIGELNGVIQMLPNPNVILNAIILGEAKESSEIENIVTTYDELYKELILKENHEAAKEVVNYKTAILHGIELVESNAFISTNTLNAVHRIVEPLKGDIRKLPGTVVKNTKTGEIVHTPPQSEEEIRDHLTNLELYLNNDIDNLDDLIKMSIIHYQFESIHPYYDGNGRTGRILNVLYLVMKKRLKYPVLFLSKYINNHKREYYELLQKSQQNTKNISEFIKYMLRGISWTSDFTISFITQFLNSMNKTDALLKERLPKIYSQELVVYLYYDFYTKNEYFRKSLNISRVTATTYLKALESNGFLVSEKKGKEVIYKNVALFDLIKTW